MGKKGRDMVSPKTPPPEQWSTTGRDLTKKILSLRSDRLVPHIRHLNLWYQYQRDECPKELILKTKGLYPEEPEGCRNWRFCLHTGSLATGPRTKAAVWKSPRPCVKEIHLLILKCFLEGKVLVRILSGDTVIGSFHFCILLLLC